MSDTSYMDRIAGEQRWQHILERDGVFYLASSAYIRTKADVLEFVSPGEPACLCFTDRGERIAGPDDTILGPGQVAVTREQLRDIFLAGSISGHDRTVESCWCDMTDYPEEVDVFVDEILSTPGADRQKGAGE